MQIKKETVIFVQTSSGETINAGDTVIFNFDEKCCVGVYMGLSDRGALKFKGKIADTDVTYHVMPRSWCNYEQNRKRGRIRWKNINLGLETDTNAE